MGKKNKSEIKLKYTLRKTGRKLKEKTKYGKLKKKIFFIKELFKLIQKLNRPV